MKNKKQISFFLSPLTLCVFGWQTYVATLYNQAWGLGANRTQAVTSSEGASIVYNEDEFEASTLRWDC